MSENSTVDRFIKHINKHILPFIDYAKLQKSYDADMVYAKGILNRLHEAMIESYGSERLDELSGEEGFVVIPGIVHGRESKNISLALLDLDLSSSGEHWGTDFLCEHGIVSQGRDIGSPAMGAIWERIGVYDYGYTATIPGDIHIDKTRLPYKLKSGLDDFHNYRETFENERSSITFSPMSDWCMSKDYNGAECFHDGSRPLIAETVFADIIISGIPGEAHKVDISISPYEEHEHFYHCKMPSKAVAIKIATELGCFINAQKDVPFADGRFLVHFKALIATLKEKTSLRHSLEENAQKSKSMFPDGQTDTKKKSEPEL